MFSGGIDGIGGMGFCVGLLSDINRRAGGHGNFGSDEGNGSIGSNEGNGISELFSVGRMGGISEMFSAGGMGGISTSHNSRRVKSVKF